VGHYYIIVAERGHVQRGGFADSLLTWPRVWDSPRLSSQSEGLVHTCMTIALPRLSLN